MRRELTLAVILGTAVLPAAAVAQTTHDHGTMHVTVGMQPTLAEPGQGAFAALSEIVALLRSDPDTDWSAVNIDGLRQHLVDMDNLVTLTEVTATQIGNGVALRISLAGSGGAAAGRMVPAHGPVLASETGWTSDVSQDADTLVWRVSDPDDAAMIRALGFFGLMSVGDHHRAHHMALARGEAIH